MKELTHYTEALQAGKYLVRLVPVNENLPVISCEYTREQFLRSALFFRVKNLQGYHIFCRPVGYQYVLLDDLTRDILSELATFKPCMLIETSEDNFQAWLRLPEPPQSREQAFNICRSVCTLLGADIGSAEPDHLGRLPSYVNLKPERKGFVSKLRRWANRDAVLSELTPETPKGGRVLKKSTGIDRSREDFNTACKLARQNKTLAEITEYLQAHSEKAKVRKDRYAERTAAKAVKTVNLQ
jgi:hypothetical protein